MRLTRNERRAVIRATAAGYHRKAGKKRQGLEQFALNLS